MTLEQKRALAIARARKAAADAEAQIEPAAQRGAAFFNRALAEVLGAPVDIVQAGIERGTELVTGERPQMIPAIGGSESLKRGMEALGIAVARREPETPIEYIGQVGGESASLMLPMLGAARGASGTSTVGRVLRSMEQQAVARPAATAAAETIGATGAGLGRMTAEEAELGAPAAFATEAAGATLPSVAMALSPIGLAKRGAEKLGAMAFFPFTEQGAYERASRQVRSIVDDPIKVAQSIEDLSGTTLLPSARSNNPGLMALENAVLNADPAEAARVAQNTSDTINNLVQSIKSSGSVADAKQFINAKRERLFRALDARVELAGDKAATALASIAGDEASASIAARNALEEALADAKVQEAMLWRAIPQNVKASTKPVFDSYKEVVASLSRAQSDDIPDVARSIIGGGINRKVKATSILELDGLYKKLGEESAAARASGQFNKARIAETLRDSILESFDTAEGNPATREAIDTARAFSRQLNEKFRRGSVGRILGYSSEGGPRLAPELTLSATVGAPGVGGAVAMKELAQAAESPQMLEGIQSFIKDRFLQSSVREGQIVPTLADTYLRNNAELLTNFPALRDQLSSARTAADVARRVQSSADAMRRTFDNANVSATARFLNAPVDNEINRVMGSVNPVGMFEDLVGRAKQDRSGKAVSGLKAGFSSWLIDNASSPSQIDIAGRPIFWGIKFKAALENKSIRGVMEKLYSPDEIKRMDEAADLLTKLHVRSQDKRLGTILADRPSQILSIVARVIGAKAGAAASATPGGSIQSASIGSNAVRDFLNKLTVDKAQQLIVDAVQDPELMVALLRHKPNAPRAEKLRHERVIRGWMLSSGSRLVDPESYEAAQREDKQQKKEFVLFRKPTESLAGRQAPQAVRRFIEE